MSEKPLHTEEQNARLVGYIREKINDMLQVVGTAAIRPEELTDDMLIDMDPIGIITESFSQILEHLRETNIELEFARDEIEAIFNSVGVGLMVVDKDLTVLAYNDRQAELFNYGDGDWRNTKCYNLNCKRDSRSPECAARRIFEEKRTIRAKRWECFDHIYEVVGTPVVDKEGIPVMAVLSYLDITERITIQETLVRQRELLNVTLQSINEGVISVDMDCHVVLANETAQKLLNRTEKQLRGKSLVGILFEEDEITHMTGCKRGLRGQHIHRYQGSMCKRLSVGGISRLIEIFIIPVVHSKAEAPVVIILKDITDSVRMEKELLNRQKHESLGMLTGGIAHDFNNILTSVMSNISIARLDAKNYQTALTQAETALSQARNLVKQLSTFAKGGSPVKEVYSLRELLEEIAQFTLSGSRARYTLDIADDLWLVEIDVTQFGQVIHNLIINSLQAMPDGGNLYVGAHNISAGSGSRDNLKEGKYVEMIVRDSGIGIPEEYRDRIFDPFFSTKENGSGIGLATAYSIIQKHDGTIEVESSENKGTTFRVYIPASTQENLYEPVRRPAVAIDKNASCHVLLMDDDEMIIRSTSALLEMKGFSVDTALDGGEALHKVEQGLEEGRHYDLVIMDLVVPGGMGGVETLPALKQIDAGVKTIVSSGYSHDKALSEYREHGFDGVAPKPYLIEELLHEIQRVLGHNFT